MQEIRLIDELAKIHISISKTMFAMAKNQDIRKPPSPLQFKILNYLLEHKDDNVCQKDLEESLNVSKATISEVLNTMEKGGLIIRKASKTDARIKTIKLTDTSLNRFDEMNQISYQINAELIKNISEKDLKTFLSILDRMEQNLEDVGRKLC